MPSEHALLSPSSAHRRMGCVGSLALESNEPRSSSKYANEGTAAHDLAASCLTQNLPALAFIGRVIEVKDGEKVEKFTVDDDMADHVQKYVNQIHQYNQNNVLLVEERVDFSKFVDYPEQFGTSDAVIICDADEEIQVHDLKYGMGVRVDAENNEQLMTYALGAMETFGYLGPFTSFRMVIHQPRLNHTSEWSCDLDTMMNFAQRLHDKSQESLGIWRDFRNGIPVPDNALTPSEDNCKFCKAKGSCPALTDFVTKAVAEGFDDLTLLDQADELHALGEKRKIVPLAEMWCKDVMSRVNGAVLSGKKIEGLKVVMGDQGDRKWNDVKVAEATLKKMRLKQEEMYKMTVISPPQAEKLFKDTPKRWKKVKDLFSRTPGKPIVVVEKDKRPAVSVVDINADQFDDETQELA